MPEVHELAGVTFLELLANYVATTRQCPPLVGPGGKQADIYIASPQGRLQPIAVKDVVITLSAAIGCLEKVSGTKLMHGTTYKRVRSLHTIGCHASRRGFVPRPTLDSQSDTYGLLVQLVHGAHPAEALRGHTDTGTVEGYEPGTAGEEWSSWTEH